MMMNLRTPDLWVGMDAELRCEDPALFQLLDYWNDKRGGREMPARADIDPQELRRHLGNLILIDIEHEPTRLRYRLIGTRITGLMGRDSTGKYYDEIYEPELLASIYRSFEWIFANRRPLRTHGEAFYPDRNFYSYETLNLPLSSDGVVIDMVLGGLYFHPRTPPG
ncbi:PAS domain-containing protein [Minwuia thermotolerans]|uniref:PAS domain-containing protein n=1 Tax=Minwuia thermotolerans TaxID=2056226 RepID=A0A2M9G333_9PROT|nr:PAS domain-containing protein [Minwuia thermotolerans]PJK30086.1 hypothetical protein CVT23_10025 [Minwuia thermotolerans]